MNEMRNKRSPVFYLVGMGEKSEGVRFSPIFDSPREIQSFIDHHGFEDYSHFAVYENYCSIIFNNPNRDSDFCNFINGLTINGMKITAHLITPSSSSHPKGISPSPSQPRIHSRTIAIKSSIYLNDRKLYDLFKHCGFIRQVESRPACGYIQFDTESDACKAVDQMDKYVYNEDEGIILSVTQVTDRMLNIPNVVIPLSIVEKEDPPPPPPPILKRQHSQRDFQSEQRRERMQERNVDDYYKHHPKNRNNIDVNNPRIKRDFIKPKPWEKEKVRDYERGLDKL